ncbi:Rqc2 family fibronectin-binding protein [Desulfotruncus alcoholivorax]|uniref:Rqc2 family fibronectin-binding protein n=1 Tax=Desulfotruncus alcoholivorax TaxID=265477 RepID=UPI000409C6F2|nr:NFACT RNA binding domain-containing protein [Desulfotruncus alcoholivorax]
MPFDGLFLHGICKELNEQLTQGRIEKIYQPVRDEIVLIISKPGSKYRLLLSANAINARVHITSAVRANPTAPPVFCMLLRKHLEGGKIIGFYQPGLDRVLDIRVDNRDETGRPEQKSLFCEIMGRHSNIILVSRTDNTIIDGIRRYTHAVSRHREVLPGRPYIPPPGQDKTNPFELMEEQFRELVMGADLDEPLAVIVQKKLDGLSIPTCREIVELAGLPADLILDHCGEHELRALWQSLQQVLEASKSGTIKTTLVYNLQGRPADFFPIPVVPKGNVKYSHQTANETADKFFSDKAAREELRKQKALILDRIKKETKRLDKKLKLQQKSALDAGEGERYRLYGELLTANLYRVERGLKEVELENYHDPELKTITIPLIPERSGAENAQIYFKKYNKARNTLVAARKMANQTYEELQYLEGVATAVELAEKTEELEEIRQELVGQGYLKNPAAMPGRKQAKTGQPKLKPLEFTSSDGFTVLVGKNNRQNDTLTLKTAEDTDIWLHTCKIPGSHVIIRTGGRPVPDQTLLEAAALAAYYSRARESSNVPVDYTLRKHVKKPNGAKPGYVIYDKQKTIYVDPKVPGGQACRS